MPNPAQIRETRIKRLIEYARASALDPSSKKTLSSLKEKAREYWPLLHLDTRQSYAEAVIDILQRKTTPLQLKIKEKGELQKCTRCGNMFLLGGGHDEDGNPICRDCDLIARVLR